MVQRLFVLMILLCVVATAQSGPGAEASDSIALALAQQTRAALTAGNTISDITLNTSVTSTVGPDIDNGTAMFQAKGLYESRIDWNLSSGTRTEVRHSTAGIPSGSWKLDSNKARSSAQHNCWTDSAWFFPAFSSLTQAGNRQFIFQYVGLEQLEGVTVQHLRVFQQGSPADLGIVRRMSTMDFYLDPGSHLPVAVAFKLHADNNMNTNIPVEVRFDNYQRVNGIAVPYHIQRVISGMVDLDITVNEAQVNTGILDSAFTLQ